MKAAFAHVSRVISIAHMVLLGQSAGSVRGRTMEDQGACFLYASQEPPPRVVEVCRDTGFRQGIRWGWRIRWMVGNVESTIPENVE